MDLRGWTTHWKRCYQKGTGKDKKELRWRCVGLLSEGIEELWNGKAMSCNAMAQNIKE